MMILIHNEQPITKIFSNKVLYNKDIHRHKTRKCYEIRLAKTQYAKKFFCRSSFLFFFPARFGLPVRYLPQLTRIRYLHSPYLDAFLLPYILMKNKISLKYIFLQLPSTEEY